MGKIKAIDAKDELELTLEDTTQDTRSAQRSLELRIHNGSQRRLVVKHLRPYLPNGAELTEVKDASLLKFEKTYGDLCEDLRVLINDEYQFGVKDLIRIRKQQVIEFVGDIVGSNPNTFIGMIRWQLMVILKPFTMLLVNRRFVNRFYAAQISTDNYRDAKRAADALESYQVTGSGHSNKNHIALKLTQLEALEQQRSESNPNDGLLVLSPTETRSESYVVTFRRGIIATKRSTASFELTVVGEDGQTESKRASQVILVSANAQMLSLVTVLFAFFGTAVRAYLKLQSPTWTVFVQGVEAPQIFVGCVVGFLVFNTYENLGLTNTKKLDVSWRTAALVGFMCGMSSENFLNAMRAFFGFKVGQ